MPNYSFHRKFYALNSVIYISWPPQWPLNVDNLHRPHELKGSLKHWARPLSYLGSSNEPADMAEVSFQQVYHDFLICYSFGFFITQGLSFQLFGVAGPSTTLGGPSASAAESNALAKLQGLLSPSVSQILERKGLDFVRECLNNFAADGLLSSKTVTHLSFILERT